jgi:hypothetical protein
MGKGKKTSDVG